MVYPSIRFAVKFVPISNDIEENSEMIQELKETSEKVELKIIISKTNILVIKSHLKR